MNNVNKVCYTMQFWEKYYNDTVLIPYTQDCKNNRLREKDEYIFACFVDMLGFTDDLFDHVKDLQKHWELCDRKLQMSLISGWQKIEKTYNERYDYEITHDENGVKLNPGKNINLS